MWLQDFLHKIKCAKQIIYVTNSIFSIDIKGHMKHETAMVI